MSEKKQANPDKLGFGNLLVWNSRAISTSVYTLLAGFLMTYCTDTLHITPAYVSVILVVSKLVDGVTDAMAGFIVDRTQTKWGKGRPYEVFVIALWFFTWLMFSTPTGFSEIIKVIWIFIMYTLVNSICYTFLNANSTVYLVRAFKESQIVKLTSYSSVITMLAAVVFNVAFPQLLANFGQTAGGWRLLVGGFAITMGAIGILRFLFVPEKYDVGASGQKEEKVKFSDIFRVIKGNKYILILALMTLVFSFVTNMGTNVYYYTWVVGDVGAMSFAAIAQIVAIPLAFLFPVLLKKTTVVKLMFIGFIVSAVGWLMNFFAVANVPMLAVAAILTGAGTIPASMLAALAILECAEFNEFKGIPRMEGTMSSIRSLSSKVGAAVGTGALGVILTAIGYKGELAVQSAATIMGIRALFSIVPAILYVVVAFTLVGYFKLDKQMPEIRAKNAEKRQSAVSDPS